MDNLLN